MSLTIEEPEPMPTNSQHPDELTDEDEIDIVDDNFIPGCAIDINHLPFPKSWIRADYIRIYNYLESRDPTPDQQSPTTSSRHHWSAWNQ
jgi:hypothetical protein